MRQYHNSIKRQYIHKYTKAPTKNVKLLDLACGKGGDLRKWIDSKSISLVRGFDINSDSISEAKRRLAGLKSGKGKDITFNTSDLSKEVLHCKTKFDVITCFFAFHYFFKNKSSLDTILTSIKNCSKKGTVIILTLLDGDLVRNMKTDNFYIKIDNSVTVSPSGSDTSKNKVYGRELEVYIKSSVLDTPEIEYIVEPNTLIERMNSINFDLIDTKLFSQFNYSKFGLSKDEKMYSFINRVFVFKKF